MMRWKDAFKRGIKAWHMREKWATVRVKWKRLCKTRNTPHCKTAVKGERAFDTHNSSSVMEVISRRLITCQHQQAKKAENALLR